MTLDGSAHQDRMIRFFGCIGQAGAYVFSLKIRVIGENICFADPGCQQIKDILDADAHAANAWPSAALLGVESDPLHQMELRIRWAAVKPGIRGQLARRQLARWKNSTALPAQILRLSSSGTSA